MNSPNRDTGVARSGVNGPLTVGSSSERFYVKNVSCEISAEKIERLTISMTSSYSVPLSALRKPCPAAMSAAAATPERPVAFRYDRMWDVYGNVEVVAPTSAPMLAMVARPVHDWSSTPGPKYSRIRPVPPCACASVMWRMIVVRSGWTYSNSQFASEMKN